MAKNNKNDYSDNQEQKSFLQISPLEEYGVECQSIKISDEELSKCEKIPLAGFYQTGFDFLFHNAPDLFANETTIRMAEKTANTALKDAYKVSFKEGFHLANSKVTKGAFRASLLSNVNNQVGGQAELLPIDPISISRIPQLAFGVFKIASFLTGQLYLSDINHKLSNIEAKTQEIKSFLIDDKQSRMWAIDQSLKYTYFNIQEIMNNEDEKAATLVELKNIRRESLSNVSFNSIQLNRAVANLDEKTKVKAATNKIEEIYKYLPELWSALDQFSKATVLMVYLSGMDSEDYLNSVSKELQYYRESYKRMYDSCSQKITQVLNSNRLNKSSVTEKIMSLLELPAADLATSHISGLLAYGGVKMIKNSVEENRKDTKDQIKEKEKYLRLFQFIEPLEQAQEAVDHYKKMRNKPLEIIQTADGYYVNYMK